MPETGPDGGRPGAVTAGAACRSRSRRLRCCRAGHSAPRGPDTLAGQCVVRGAPCGLSRGVGRAVTVCEAAVWRPVGEVHCVCESLSW